MKSNMVKKLFFLTGIMMVLSLVNAFGGGAQARGGDPDTFPRRAITVIVPNAPGGGADLTARTVARFAPRYLGVEMIIENRPGGGQTVAHTFFNSTPADGHTIIIYGNSATTVTPSLMRVAYDPLRDQAPIARVTNLRNALVVRNDAAANTLEDFINHARANPGIRVGVSGVNGIGDFTVHLMNQRYNTGLVPVGYDSAGEVVFALMGGEVAAMIGSLPAARSQIEAGTVRPLAFVADSPDPDFPEVRTALELGYNISLNNSIGFAVRAGTNPEYIRILENFFLQLPNNPEFQEAMRAGGMALDPLSSEDFLRLTINEIETVSSLARLLGLHI